MTLLKVLCVIACCTCLAGPICGYATADDGDEGENPDFRTINEQLDGRVRALFGSGGGGGGSNGTRAGPKLTDASSFFRNGFKLGRHRATTFARPKDAEDGGGETTAAEGSEGLTTTGEGTAEEGTIVPEGTETATDGATTTTTTDRRRVKFTTESECASANGGRPCVCLVADFLARLRRTDDETAAAEYECPSYVAAPKAFVASPAAAAAVQTTSGESGAVSKNDTAAAARKPVDFDHVVHYSLDRSKDGASNVIALSSSRCCFRDLLHAYGRGPRIGGTAHAR